MKVRFSGGGRLIDRAGYRLLVGEAGGVSLNQLSSAAGHDRLGYFANRRGPKQISSAHHRTRIGLERRAVVR
jgi:hypothetical protein